MESAMSAQGLLQSLSVIAGFVAVYYGTIRRQALPGWAALAVMAGLGVASLWA
jgi:hypothetical protein